MGGRCRGIARELLAMPEDRAWVGRSEWVFPIKLVQDLENVGIQLSWSNPELTMEVTVEDSQVFLLPKNAFVESYIED